MNSNLNVILDVSMLGIGFYHRQAKTGVSRVAEQLLDGLWQADDIQLSLAAPTHLPEAMRYAQAHFGPSAPAFVNRPAERTVARLENGVLSPFPVGSVPSKAIRAGAYKLRKFTGSHAARFDTQSWHGRIYHSPFYEIPEAVAQSRAVQSVQTIHDLIPIFHPEWFPAGDNSVRSMLARLNPQTHIITISEATRNDFCQHTGTDPARVTPIHLAASPALFYPVTDPDARQRIRQRYQLGDAPYLLSLATFEPRKNLDRLIRAFVNTAQSGEIPAEVKLVLVGARGWKLDQILNELASHQALQSRIVVTGFVPDEELAALYSGATGFVYPSLYEGFGLPPLEAMQCGLPVITSRIPAIREVVGEAALYISPTDTDDLCQAMVKLVSSDTLRAGLAQQGLQRARLFSWSRFIAEHVALYRQIVS
ncbi:glycosyltransferase involved in cell wall biosynthesis [Spirosoma lacussanchae]|uniref:glycosyltransferase family 4 protein n=1 Tax=Spirosoma lacussanchae TaxID=1884249 RepID=UPI001109DB2A|nr:glycosyltransferase family 1 protein [Spirosoma lacussanchae]